MSTFSTTETPCPPGTATLSDRYPGAPQIDPVTLQRMNVFTVWGNVANAATTYPLTGVGVSMRATGACSSDLLGEGVTNAEGGFRIHNFDSPCVLERLRLIALGEANCTLDIVLGREQKIATPCPINGKTHFPVSLLVALNYTPVTKEVWAGIARQLMQYREARLHTLASALIAPGRESMFADLDLETRHSVLFELEQAVLDPNEILRKFAPTMTFYRLHQGGLEELERLLTGKTDERATAAFSQLQAKVNAYRDLLEMEWIIDLDAMAEGNIVVAVNQFSGGYAEDVPIGQVPGLIIVGDISRYRDYLRTLFTGGPKSSTYATNLALLKNRFHQDFETLDTTDKPANDILVNIVKAILQAPKAGSYGFEIPAASIQPQGASTTREYLDYLIGLAQIPVDEFGRRYRLDLKRPDASLSSPVAENIATLQRFFSDAFQDEKEPSPVVPVGLKGRAPFFLYYEEWLALDKPFYPENVYQPLATFTAGIEPAAREQIKSKQNAKWVNMLLEIEDALPGVVTRMNQNEFGLARDLLLEIDGKAHEALIFSRTMAGSEKITEAAVSSRLEVLKTINVKTPTDLSTFINFYRAGLYERDTDEINPYDTFEPWLNKQRLVLWFSLIHLRAMVIPTLLGDCAFASGDYLTAIEYYRRGTLFLVASGQLESKAGYPATKLVLPDAVTDPMVVTSWQSYVDYYGFGGSAFHKMGGLPYTVDLNKKKDPLPLEWWYSFTLLETMAAKAFNKLEVRFLKLRQGLAMLEWADALYRSDDGASVQRARELYKSVLWLHGAKPPSLPRWTASSYVFFNQGNPALTGQRARSLLGIEQIEAGLNWYGSNDSMVPILRYQTLKNAADRYAAAAYSAQQDFLASMGKLEEAIRDSLLNNNMLKKASLQESISAEQIKIAEFDVVLSQLQVAAVEGQISAKKKEIDDHDSLGGQFGDLIEGMTSIIGKIPGGVTDKVGTGVAVGSGISSSEAAGMSVAAGGAVVLGAMAAVIVLGVMTLDNMADAQLSRHQQLAALKDKALPLAKQGVQAKQREVTIAQYQKQIAAADMELAKSLIQFQQSRFLNENLWAELSAVMRRVMRRYLTLGGRYGWLAERALAFEQDRTLDIVRFDYFPSTLQGVTGADLLQADLAELDAVRLEGIKQTVPIKHTYSMVADFPLQFAELKKTGRCTFLTRELPFHYAYPGSYGYRIRAVTLTPRSYSGIERPRGLLTNMGISTVSRADGSSHAILRPEDAQPMSEFRIADDMQTYGMPDEALLAFEGSGIETVWQLSLPALANRQSLDDLADIEMTVDVRAKYSPKLRALHLQTAPTTVRRLTFFSARAFAKAGYEALVDVAQSTVTIEFDIPAIGRLSRLETGRVLRNVVLTLPGMGALSFPATFTRQGSPSIAVNFADGLAYSNTDPLGEAGSQIPPSPLNGLTGGIVDTVFQLQIDKGANAAAFGNVQDVLFGIEYTASLV